MKATKKLSAKIASLALVILMLIGTVPVDAFAQETSPATPSTTVVTSDVADSGTPDKPTLVEPTQVEPTLGEPAGTCTCIALCTEGNNNADCPVCKDGLAKCAFVAPVPAVTPTVKMETRATGKTIYCGTPTGGQLGDGLTPQTPVTSLKYAAELAEGGTIYMTSEIYVKNDLVVDGLGATVKAYSTLGHSMIYVQDGANVTLTNITFDGANLPSNFNWEMIQVGEGTLTLGSGVTLQNCKSSGNSATALTIYPYATVIIDGGSITNNQCGTSIDGAAGGGVTINGGTLQLKSGSITGNTLYDGTTPSDVKIQRDNGTFIMNGSATVGTVVFLDGWNPPDCGTTKIELTSALASDVTVRRGYDNRSLAVGRVVAQGGNGYTLTAADIEHLKLFSKEAFTNVIALKSDTNQAVIKSKPHTVKAHPATTNGTLVFDSPTAYVGDTVSFTATPAEGYFADTTIFEISFRGNTQSWPVTYASGKYSFTIPNGTNSNPNTILVKATFKLKTDTIAPTVTAPTVTLADKKATVTMACTNTAGTGDGEYASDLAYYAVVIDQNPTAPTPPEVSGRTAITNNALPASWTESKAVDRVGDYYAHLFVWDTAGNCGKATTVFSNLKAQTLADPTHTSGGGFFYKLEYGVDKAVPLTMKNTTVFDTADIAPSPLISFSLKDPSQKIISLANGKLTPAGIGSTIIVATAAETASHSEKTQEITVEVKLPIAVCLAVGKYDNDGKGNDDGLTVTPSYTCGWYDKNDASRTLQIRKSGETAWTTIPATNWSWDNPYIVPFKGLDADTVYELSLSVSDQNSTPHTAQSIIRFSTPKAQSTNTGGIEGSVSGMGKITVSVELGNTVIASVGGLDSGDTFKFTNLPDGEYNLVAATSEHKVTKMVTVKDGKTTKITVVVVGKQQSVVKVKDGAPPVAANGLQEMFNTDIYQNNTEATDAVATGGTVEMRLTADEAKSNEANEIRKKVTDQTVGRMVDLTVDMIITQKSGFSSTENINDTKRLMKIAVPLENDEQGKQNYHMFRYHEIAPNKGKVDELTQLNTNVTPTTEGFFVSGPYAYVYTNKFSTYAIAFDKSGGGGTSGKGSGGGTAPNVVVPTIDKPWSPESTGVALLLQTKDHIKYINGYEDLTVKPERKMTRAEAAQMFYNLLLDKGTATQAAFSDVNGDAWYAKAVNKLTAMGVFKGYEDGTFGAKDFITREEFCAIATRFARVKGTKSIADFRDVTTNMWSYGSIMQASALGWVNGYANGNFLPKNTITRSEVVTIVNNMLGRNADAAFIKAHKDMVKFTDLQNPKAWYYEDMAEASIEHEYVRGVNGVESWTGSGK